MAKIEINPDYGGFKLGPKFTGGLMVPRPLPVETKWPDFKCKIPRPLPTDTKWPGP